MSADRMSAESEQIDELLNAFLDGELSSEEAARVEKDLASDKELQDRFEKLQSTSNQLHGYFAAAKSNTREVDFVRGFLEAETASPVQVASKETATWQRVAVVWGLVAASIFAVSFLPQNATEQPRVPNALVQQEPETPDASAAPPQVELNEAAPTQYVSEMAFPALMYLLEVDIEVTEGAFEADVLKNIFGKHDIPIDTPLVVNDEIRGVIEKSRMRVKSPNSDEDGESALLYVVRAPINSLGSALDDVYRDEVSFPVVKFALGFDTPNVSLFKTLLRNSGDLFAIDQAFTAPISVPDEPSVASPFRGLGSEGLMVSREARRSGFRGQQMAVPSGLDAGSLENVLLFVRIAN